MAAEAIARQIADGALIALPPDHVGAPVAVAIALVRRGARGLRLLGVPQLGLVAEILIAGGCVAEVETAAVSLGEFGIAPCFERARREGRVAVRESTCPAIHAALQAAEKGVPFLPLRGVIGSDLLQLRPDWKVVDNPFAPGDPILLVPAIQPDIALFHVPFADRNGHVFIGIRRELATMAHAAARTLVTVERIVEEDLLADDRLAAGTLSCLYVDALAEVPGGARPLGLEGAYKADPGRIAAWVEAARQGGDPLAVLFAETAA
jgi:glutaconate CoA-transferase subunit A